MGMKVELSFHVLNTSVIVSKDLEVVSEHLTTIPPLCTSR